MASFRVPSALTANHSMPPFRSILRSPSAHVLLLAMLSLLACGGDAARPSRVVGVTLLTREDEFYRELEDGLRKAAAAHGYRLIVTSGDRDLARQQSQIDDFIVRKVDAIIVCAVDSKGIGPAIEKANSAKIPVFTADIAANADAEARKSIVGGTALKADIPQQPREIGTRTIDAIADHFAGRPPAPRVSVPVRIVDADSVGAMQTAIDAIADHLCGRPPAPRVSVPVRIVDADSVGAMQTAIDAIADHFAGRPPAPR